jgi:drug/metabolite transporter (DMT)-like permease
MTPASSALRIGAWLAVLAAVSFGVTAPLVKVAAAGAGPFATAALLYAGACGASLVLSARAAADPPPRLGHAPRLLAVALLGAVIAPASLAWGLARTRATTASLLLNLEAMFTVLLGWALYREAIGRRVGLALLAMTGGGAALVLGAPDAGRTEIFGPLAITAATLAWALDNALTRPLSALDPNRIVLAKAGIGAALSAAISLARGEAIPSRLRALALLGLGALGYGVSLRFYLLAQRRLGAARTGSIFAIGPFVGVVVAWAIGERELRAATLGAGLLFALGVHLHVTEQHPDAEARHEHA